LEDFPVNVEQRIEELIKELSKPGREALQASTALSEIGALAVVQLVKTLKGEEDDYTRKLAALSLGRIGKPAIDPLLETLQSDDADDRRYAVEALSHIRSEPRVLGAIFQARKDSNEQVRQAAWRALERLPAHHMQKRNA
jgi:HEAT repeat protein